MALRNINKLPYNLPQLQNFIKRDPVSYKDEFIQQYRHYNSLIEVFSYKTAVHDEGLAKLVMFLAQVSHCYPDYLTDFPTQLMTLLKQHSSTLETEMRLTFCRGLIMLRNKGLVEPITLLELFFSLFRCHDKILRKVLFNYAVQDIKLINTKRKDSKLNRKIQIFLYALISDNSAVTAKKALDILIEMYRRNIWRDAKTVNAIATACFSKVTKIMVASVRFFLGSDTVDANVTNDSDDEDEKKPSKKTAEQLQLSHRVGKKSKKRLKRLQRSMSRLKKSKKKVKTDTETVALNQIYDPQDMAERLFRQLERSREHFEVRLLIMNLISRLIGYHQLILLHFYSFIPRFLQPHQLEVTRILLFAAQACHELVPPEVVEPVIKTIADNFVSERNSSDVMAVGLNAVREICARCPLGMTDTLLTDLAQYKKHKKKSVCIAARSLIQLFRQKNPELLHKKDRGRPTEAQLEVRVRQFAQPENLDFISGAESLKTAEQITELNEVNNDGWESASESEDDDDSDDGEWIDVHHSSDDEQAAANDESANLTLAEREERAREITQSRILTQEEFKQIRHVQRDKALQKVHHTKRAKKRKADESAQELAQGDGSELVRIGAIERIHKRQKSTKEARVASIMKGREDRPKFGSRQKRQNPHASTTNKEKRKTKNFMMVRHKLKGKKRSFTEKKNALKKSLMKRMKKSKK